MSPLARGRDHVVRECLREGAHRRDHLRTRRDVGEVARDPPERRSDPRRAGQRTKRQHGEPTRGQARLRAADRKPE